MTGLLYLIMERYIDLAQNQGLTGADALDFAVKQIEMEREERREAREKEREDKAREHEAKEKERETKERLHQRDIEERENERQHELELAKLRCASESRSVSETSRGKDSKGPRMPTFDEERDDMDSYLKRFERHAHLNGWPKEDWAGQLSALLTGKALM